MKKGLLIVCSLLFLCALQSCKEKMPETLKPNGTTVEGNLGALYEVVEGDYSLDKNSSAFDFDIKRNDLAPIEFDKVGVGYKIYDEDGSILSYKNPVLNYPNPADIPSDVLELKPGETGSMRIYLEEWPDKLAGAKTFKLILTCEKSAQEDAEESTDSNIANNESTGTSNNWDSVLDDYEEFVDKYIKLVKKAQSGDLSAMTEYATCLEKAESLQSKLEDAKSDMTPAQIARMNKIITKLSKAAM
ncbi:MAG: hypothetical protein K2I35_03445 [Duncaniella sp.]|nr:hypothetical protein [Duncaniella sp.]